MCSMGSQDVGSPGPTPAWRRTPHSGTRWRSAEPDRLHGPPGNDEAGVMGGLHSVRLVVGFLMHAAAAHIHLDGSKMTASVRRTLCLALVLPFFGLALVAGTGAAQATPDHFNPPKGATFNNPFGGNAARFRINTKLIRTINSVRPGHKIRIASWNYRSPGISHALIRAHQRGVSVRVIM